MEDKLEEFLENIIRYFNSKYKEAVLSYGDKSFEINGTNQEEMDKMKK